MLQVKVKNWQPARAVFKEFIEAHPELGLTFSETAWKVFSRVHGPKLKEQDVLRKPNLRAPSLANVETFDEAAFELLSKGGYKVE